jgi:hypothetical protein
MITFIFSKKLGVYKIMTNTAYIGAGVISILFIVFFIWQAISNARAAN